jgi:Domain of unknown function (DUF4760)
MELPHWGEHDLLDAWHSAGQEISQGWVWVTTYAEAHLSYAPLLTLVVAMIAGGIALYAVHAQRQIARRRAAIDFFLKTEMDDALLKRFSDFESKVVALNAAMTPTTTMDELSAMADYPFIRGYLNIHELIAVGIRLKAFDKKVCYHYWSTVLVEQCDAAHKIIEVARKDPEDHASYIETLRLKKTWERKIQRWRWRQGLPTGRPSAVVLTPISPMAPSPAPAAPPPPDPNDPNP